MGGKLSRTKGHSFERTISIALRLVFPDARRHLEYQDAEANGIDIVNTDFYKVQCKRGKKYASLSAIKEVCADELLGDIPVLVTKGDNERILACLPFEHFIDLLQFRYGLKQVDEHERKRKNTTAHHPGFKKRTKGAD